MFRNTNHEVYYVSTTSTLETGAVNIGDYCVYVY